MDRGERKEARQDSAKDNKANRKFGIKKKLLSVMIPLVIIIIAGIITTSYVIMSNVMTKEAMNTITKEASANEGQLEIWVQNILGPLSSVKQTFNSVNLSDETARLKYLQSTMNQNDSMKDGVYVSDDTGYYLFPSGWQPGADWVSYERGWYKESVNNENFAFGTPYLDSITGQYAVTAACNTKTVDGKQIMLASDVLLTNVSQAVSKMTVMNTGYAFLVDSKTGTILAHKDESYNAKTLAELTDDKLMVNVSGLIANPSDTVSKVDTNDGAYYVKLNTINNTNWVLVNYVSVASVMSELRSLQRLLIILAIILLIATAIIVERTIHFIILPIGTLTSTLTRITDGDFTVDIVSKGNDEISEMSNALEEFIKHMRVTFAGIQDIAEELNERAGSSANSAGTLYEASAEQSESMVQMKSTVNDIAQAVQSIAENATTLANAVNDTTQKGTDANESMQGTVTVAGKGSDDMQGVKTTMDGIVSSMHELEQVVEQVEGSMEEINGIIEMISSIAEQTNLLSLNASIEAARAGETGKGFAVVATEIGKLAADSGEATGKIANIIHEITQEMASMIEKTKKSLADVSKNSEQVDEAGVTFASIYEEIGKTSDVIEQMMERMKDVDEVATSMAAISEQQSASTEEMLATIESLASNAESITDDSKSVSQSAEVLSKSSSTLNQYLGEFKIK